MDRLPSPTAPVARDHVDELRKFTLGSGPVAYQNLHVHRLAHAIGEQAGLRALRSLSLSGVLGNAHEVALVPIPHWALIRNIANSAQDSEVAHSSS